MFRHVITSLPLVAGLVFVTGCGTETFDTQDSGRSVTFDVGDQFEVHLPVDNAHGDRWALEKLDQTVVKSLEAPEPEEPSEEGASTTLVLPFECAAPGTTHMVIAESDPDGRLVGTFNLDVRCKGDAAEAEEVAEEE
jgi:hypothetical protein